MVVPNSGFKGGKFLTRTVFVNPRTGVPYQPHEIFIGAKINLNGWIFIIQEASENALRIMESKPDLFVKCDLSGILALARCRVRGKISELLAKFQEKDKRKKGFVSLDEMQEVCSQFNLVFGDQEFLTVFRRFQIDELQFDYNEFIKNLE